MIIMMTVILYIHTYIFNNYDNDKINKNSTKIKYTHTILYISIYNIQK